MSMNSKASELKPNPPEKVGWDYVASEPHVEEQASLDHRPGLCGPWALNMRPVAQA